MRGSHGSSLLEGPLIQVTCSEATQTEHNESVTLPPTPLPTDVLFVGCAGHSDIHRFPPISCKFVKHTIVYICPFEKILDLSQINEMTSTYL